MEAVSSVPMFSYVWFLLPVVFLLFMVFLVSVRRIGPTEVGLVQKRFGFKKLIDDNPVALNGEAGYQADLLMPGLRFKLWPMFSVYKYPWVQVPADGVGVVFAQVGKRLPHGAKSAVYKEEFGNFADIRRFISGDGQKGVQRPVLPPGTIAPIHPVGFLVVTRNKVFGMAVSEELKMSSKEGLTCKSFGLEPAQLNLVRIMPSPSGKDKDGHDDSIDMIGIVTTLEGEPLPSGNIANRLGDFQDAKEMEMAGKTDADVIEVVLGNKNGSHNSYQDFQRFLDCGGRMGLQHDPLLYGAYALNPLLVRVEPVPMLVVRQGEVAVIKSYVGLPTEDTSGTEFKFGSIVKPGHRGIWREPLRTGKYPVNPRCYQAEVVPTAILTLNWAEATSLAHNLDAHLSQIKAKSREGFEFSIDLQVQIHVPDQKAPKVISMVGTMYNLVNEVLQPAVGNHFRDKLQGMEAISFIQQREGVQKTALEHISTKLGDYDVETRGVYIQDVILPEELVKVLKQREIAVQQKETYTKEKEAQETKADLESARGKADKQSELAQSLVNVEIKNNLAKARENEGRGEAAYKEQTGRAAGAEVESIGLAKAKAFREQREAIGEIGTALVNAIEALSKAPHGFIPQTLVTSSNGAGSGVLDGLAAMFMQNLNGNGRKIDTAEPKEETKKG